MEQSCLGGWIEHSYVFEGFLAVLFSRERDSVIRLLVLPSTGRTAIAEPSSTFQSMSTAPRPRARRWMTRQLAARRLKSQLVSYQSSLVYFCSWGCWHWPRKRFKCLGAASVASSSICTALKSNLLSVCRMCTPCAVVSYHLGVRKELAPGALRYAVACNHSSMF